MSCLFGLLSLALLDCLWKCEVRALGDGMGYLLMVTHLVRSPILGTFSCQFPILSQFWPILVVIAQALPWLLLGKSRWMVRDVDKCVESLRG